MRIVVDALAARKGGTARAAAQVARALADHANIERVVLFTQADSIVASALPEHPALSVELLPAVTRAELLRRVWWEAVTLPALLQALGATHLLSWSGMLPRPVPIPVLCHISNALMFETPGRFDEVRKRVMARTARSGAHFATPSAAMSEAAREAIGDTAKVIPLGVDPQTFFPAEALGKEIICVADFYAHKRHDLVLDVWARLEEPRPPLRLIGDPTVDPAWHRTIVDRATALGRLGAVHFQSGLDPSDVGAAYRSAGAFLLASEHESFNLPLLEAQASGLPTVVRDLPALRETGGPSTVLVRGDDADAWTRAIRMARSAAAGAIDERAVEHAAPFTWPQSAAAIYEEFVGLG